MAYTPFRGQPTPPSPWQLAHGAGPGVGGSQFTSGSQPMQAGMAPMGMHQGIGGSGLPLRSGYQPMQAGMAQMGQPRFQMPPGGGLGLPGMFGGHQLQQGPPGLPQGPQQGFQVPQGQSVEQAALAGGGVDNKQQISNFIQALQQAGSAGGNSFMGTPQQTMPQQIPPQMTQQLNPQAFNPAMVQPQTRPAFGMQPQSAFMSAMQPQAPMPRMAPQVARPNVAMMSDEEAKEDIKAGAPDLKAFLSSLGAWNYRYKSPELDGEGEYTSPMAQELERTALGKQAVIDTPRGKMVDYARLGGVNLAAAAVVHRENLKLAERIKTLEKQFRGR